MIPIGHEGPGVKMLRAVNTIEGVGPLHLPRERDAVLLSKTVVIQAENAVGKSTLAAVLRSLGTGRSEELRARRRLDGRYEPLVEITLSDGCIASFQSGNWQETDPSVWVYDGTFVEENVYAHSEVEPEQRRSLLEFALGATATRLMASIDEASSCAWNIEGQMRGLRSELDAECRQRYAVLDEVLALDLLEAHELATRADGPPGGTGAGDLQDRPTFELLYLPVLDLEAIVALLGREAEGDVEASQLVAQHVAAHLGDGGWRWLREGWAAESGERCPFCGQNDSQSLLVQAYAMLFGSCAETVALTEELLAEAERAFSDVNLDDLVMALTHNRRAATAWQGLPGFVSPGEPVDALGVCSQLGDDLRTALRAKSERPLERPPDMDQLARSVARLHELEQQADTYNEAVSEANRLIEQRLVQPNAENDVSEQDGHSVATARSRIALDAEVTRLAQLRAEKDDVLDQRKQLRDELRRETDRTLRAYGPAITARLASFGADFALKDIKQNDTGGKPHASWTLRLRSHNVPLKTKPGSPTFRTILSQSDKDVLALAFFFAKSDALTDAQTAELTVVFDDPVVGFDEARKHAVVGAIDTLSRRGAQIIVLSHDPTFLDELLACGFEQSLCLRRGEEGSGLTPRSRAT